MNNQSLKKFLSNHFIRFSLIPILVVEITLLILYFSINKYIATKNSHLMLDDAIVHAKDLLRNESNLISQKLTEISRNATLLQKEHETIFKNSSSFALPNGMPSFDVATNGVFYKTNEIGSSLYYSSKTSIGQKEKEKAIFTEAMDTSLKNIVDINPLIVASYFNSWDDMNRLYPFIPKVYEQYGEHIHMEDYNFYYLADEKHNPKKEAVWTGAYLDPAGNGWMLSCIIPIYNNGFLEGVTGLDITIDSFVKNILNAQLPYDAKLFMVDKEGMILAMPEKIEELLSLKELKEHLYTDVLLKTIEKPEEYNILRNKSPFASHFKNLIENKDAKNELKIKDSKYLTLIQNVDETNWKMMILIDEEKIFSSINDLEELSNKIGYMAIFGLVIFYVLFFYVLLKRMNLFSNKITKPIVDLSEQTTLISEKGISFKTIDTNISEISKLNENFYSMIKELKVRSDKLNEARIIAENANKTKDEFLANISHELKTPLNSINIISSIMKKNKDNQLNEEQVKNMNIINSCGNNLLILINDILDLSKLDAGKINIKYEKIDTQKFFSNIYNNFESQMKDKNLQFSLNIEESLDLIYSDKNRIEQIVNNLLSNALKFTKNGKKISLLVKNESNNIKIIVEDEGIGIPKEHLDSIFDRFSQVDGTTTRNYGGTGLGLSICKQLLNLLKGEISVSSQINIGSKFEVILPKNESLINSQILEIEEVEPQEEELVNIEDNSPVEIEKQIEKNKLLVLNNDPVNFFNLIIELKKKYDVVQVLTLNKLLEKISSEKFEKVIVDISKLQDSDKELISENLGDNFVLFYENEIDEKFSQSVVFQKPLTNEMIKTI